MKEIKIKIVGFWPEFDVENNFIVNILKHHFNVVFSDSPDYLISSCFSDEYLHYPDAIRIFYTGENICPDFNAFDYAISFENINFGDRHIRFPNYLIPEVYKNDYDLMLVKHLNIDSLLDEKQDFCSFVVSKGNGYVMPEREIFFHKLSKYKKVNSGGRYLNNIGLPDGVPDKLEFQKRHKFSIAFENSGHNGYTTEKIVQAFAAQTVPIYFGDSKVTDVFNEKAFINCHDFDSFDKVIEQVKKIDSDDSLYYKIISEPALKINSSIEQENRRLEDFLLNIFSQSKEKAFRRDLHGYGQKHCDYLLKCESLFCAPKKKNVIDLILEVPKVVLKKLCIFFIFM